MSIDAIEKANSGHPGLPLGATELAALLYGKILKHYPQNPHWINRDRFVFIGRTWFDYALFRFTFWQAMIFLLTEIKDFENLVQKCAGHPEYRACPGIEATTGPLGQGVAMAVGMAVSEKNVSQAI